MSFNRQYRPSGFGHLPVVTKNIIIINVIMYLATILLIKTKDFDLTSYFGLHYYLAPDFKPHQFITYIFMHSTTDPMHIVFNMIGVYVFGQVLEQVWGPKRYLIFYIVTGLGAALAQYVVMHFEIQATLTEVNQKIAFIDDPAEKARWIEGKFRYLNDQVIVGASGSLMGLLGAFGMLFPNTELLIYFLFPVKAKWIVIFYGLFELFSGISNSPGDNVAHFAHIGGLIVGIILVLIWRRDRQQFY
jgi:membrane associated rhomboid family serine protease